jgi:excisionase family DNA binding protein
MEKIIEKEAIGAVSVISDLDAVASLIASAIRPEIENIRASRAEPYLDVDQAAAYMRCPKSRIYELSSSGKGPRFVRDGKRLLTRESWIDAYLIGEEV